MAGLYIHIPFCHSKCAYCDFFSTPHIANIEQYADALLSELELRAHEISTPFTTIYIGGGTPSILQSNTLERIVKGVSRFVDIATLKEFTIEANPEDVTDQWTKTLIQLGINRVSIGIQSFNDSELKAINRRHTAQKAIEAINILQQNGIYHISGDLIYGLPGQDIISWKKSLDQLMSLQLPHFSAYLLSYEPGTRLYARLITGKIEEASEELVNEMYQYLTTTTRLHGYNHYEISNFATPGNEAVHNCNYWKDMPYLGIGVSAHSFDGQIRRFNPSNIKNYISQLLQGECIYEIENEDAIARHNDYIIVSLRTAQGIDLNYYRSKYNYDILSIAKSHINAGRMILSDSHLAIAESAMLISDRIMLDFIR